MKVYLNIWTRCNQIPDLLDQQFTYLKLCVHTQLWVVSVLQVSTILSIGANITLPSCSFWGFDKLQLLRFIAEKEQLLNDPSHSLIAFLSRIFFFLIIGEFST